jgi:O-antigen/teichoic acid export membrane protein
VSIRGFARDVAVYGSGDLVLRVAGLLTLPIYARILAPGQFGVWNFLVTIMFLLNGFVLLGGDAALARFHFAAANRSEQQVLTTTTFLFVGLTGFVLAASLVPFSGAFSTWTFGGPQYAILFTLVLLAAPTVALNTIAGQALRNQFRAGTFVALNVAAALVTVGVSLALLLLRDLGVTALVAGALAGSLAVLPFRLWAIRGLLRPTFSATVLRRVLVFGVPLMPAAIAEWTLSVSDRLVLGTLAGFHELGLYTVAANVVSIITFLLAPLANAWAPHAMRAYEREPGYAAAFYGRVMTYILVGFGFLAVFVTAFAPEILRLLAPPEFLAAEFAVAPLALAAVAFATTPITSVAIGLRHRTVYIAGLVGFVAAVNVVLNVLFVPQYGMRASAWATAACAVLLTLSYLLVSQRLWPVSYEWRRVAAIAAATVVFTLAARYLPSVGVLMAVPMKMAYCALFLAALISLRAVDQRERTVLQVMLRLTPRGGSQRAGV